MADYRKINALAKDTARAQRLAQFLLTLTDQSWTEWELNFLDAMSTVAEELSTRQAEKLHELEEASVWYEKVPGEGFSVRLLLRNCHAARADLESDEDVAFLEKAVAAGTTRLRRRGMERLLRIARQLEVIEPDAGRTFDRRLPDAA